MLPWTYITTQNSQILITEHLSTLTHQEAVNIFAKIYGRSNHYFLPYHYSLDINKSKPSDPLRIMDYVKAPTIKPSL